MATEIPAIAPSFKLSEILKPPEAAKLLGISKSQLRELTIAGRIPALDRGVATKHFWRYHRPTLEEWLRRNIIPAR